ncbi:arylamine N-acetyltransferase family protein [Bradyrhizobium sp. USDA 4353]
MPSDFNFDKYLARIGYRGALTPTFETLAGLQAAHVDAIAFEGIDPLLGRPVNIDLASVQAKIVDGRRGGYCFEQNALFKAALEAIGFAVTPLSARVRWRLDATAPHTPRTHMMLKVDLPEGPYIADVGFGSCLLDTPLRMVPDIAQRTAMGTFRLTLSDGMYWLAARQPTGWRMMYVFDLTPQIHADYMLSNWFTSTSPLTPFTSMLILERLTSELRYKLVNRRLVVEARDGEIRSEQIIETPEALQRVVEEIFGVTFPVDVDVVWARIES